MDCSEGSLPKQLKFLTPAITHYTNENPEFWYKENQAREFVLQRQGDILVDKDGKPAKGCGKYVYRKNGCIYYKQYTSANLASGLAHTQIGQGMPILAGGWISFKEGKIDCLTFYTGHYGASAIHLQQLTNYLDFSGLSFNKDCELHCEIDKE
jgi:hypothetical protein